MALFLTPYTPSEEREYGVYDWLVKQHERIGIRYLGGGGFAIKNVTWSVPRLDTPYDMVGHTFRTAGLYKASYDALGIKGVDMPMEDIYAGLERGLVDGLTQPVESMVAFRIQEVVNYMYLPPMFNSVILLDMNMDKWNSLSKQQQEWMEEAAIKMEEYIEVEWTKSTKELWKFCEDEGVEIINWPEADAEWFVETSQGAAWDLAIKLDPTYGPELKVLFEKK